MNSRDISLAVLSTYNSNKSEIEINKYYSEGNKSFYAFLIGKIMGDGHLDKNYSTQFISKSKKDLNFLKKLIIKELKISSKKIKINRREKPRITFSLRLNYCILGRILFSLGAPMGNKVKKAFSVPEWIKKDNESKRMFLKGILEDELSTIKIEKKSHSNLPKFKMSKNEELLPDLRKFLTEVKTCIEDFGVECSNIPLKANSAKDQNTADHYFTIFRRKENIIKFGDEIGFLTNKDKIKKLNDCCSALSKTLQKPIDKEKIITLRKSGLSIREIAKQIPHSKTTVHKVIQNHSRTRNSPTKLSHQ